MGLTYWKVVLRYGYVGHRKEVAVARYLVTPATYTIIDVNDFLQTMPGVKNRCMYSIRKIDKETYVRKKKTELENFYIQNLKQECPEEVVKKSGEKIC